MVSPAAQAWLPRNMSGDIRLNDYADANLGKDRGTKLSKAIVGGRRQVRPGALQQDRHLPSSSTVVVKNRYEKDWFDCDDADFSDTDSTDYNLLFSKTSESEIKPPSDDTGMFGVWVSGVC